MKFFFTIFIIFLTFISLSGCQKQEKAVDVFTGLDTVNKKIQVDRDLAAAQAKDLYRQAVINEVDLTNGPCLSNNLLPDWVLDVAHNPRTSADDLPANQCSAFREGLAHHFVELDLEGNIIKVN